MLLGLFAGARAHADFGVAESVGDDNAAFRAVAQSPSTPLTFVAVGRFLSGSTYRALIGSYSVEDGSVDSGFTGNNGLTGKQSYDFAGAGNDNLCNAVVWASDGYIAACRSMDASGFYTVYLIKFNSSGTLDASFGTSGIKATGIGGTTENGTVRGIAYNPDVAVSDGGGVAIVGPKGTSSAGYKPYIAVFNKKTGAQIGSTTTFDTISGTASGVVYDGATQAYYVVSTDTSGNRGLYVHRILHKASDDSILKEGTPWGDVLDFSAAGAGSDWAPTSVVVQGGNILIAGGNRADYTTPPWNCAVAAVNTSTGLPSNGFGNANVTGAVADMGVALFSHEGASPTRDCVVNSMVKGPVGTDVFLGGTAYNGTNYDSFHMRLTRGGRLVTSASAPTGFVTSAVGPADDSSNAIAFLSSEPRYLYGFGKTHAQNLKTKLLITRSLTDGFEQGVFQETNGLDNRLYTITTASDSSGDLYVGGQFLNHGVTARAYFARLNSDGSLDAGFDPGTGFNGAVRASAYATDGSGDVYVGGEFTTFNGGGQVRIARLNSDGTIDAGFAVTTGFTSAVATASVNAIAPATDGSGDVYVGGQFDTYNGTSVNRLVRLNSDGTVDSGFAVGTGIGSAASDFVSAIVVAADGTDDVYVVGTFSSYNGGSKNGIVRLNSDGTVDGSFSPGTGFSPAIVSSLAISDDDSGDVYVGGSFTSYNGTARNSFVRLHDDGSLDTGFSVGTGFNNSVAAVAVAADGSGDIYVGGSFTSYNGTSRAALARLDSSGAVDTAFTPGTGPNDDLLCLTASQGGYSDVYVGGDFTTFNGVASPYLVRLSAGGTVGQKSPVVITGVDSATADGTYGRGDVIDIKVTFSAAVTGKPQLLLETGTRDAVADYLSGSGTAEITLRYTVGAGQSSGDLDYVSASSLLANGAGLVDGTGLPVDLTLPAPGGVGSLGANRSFVISSTTPKVLYVTSTKVNGIYANGTNIPLQVIFDQPVVVTGTPRIQVETGATDRNANYTSGSGTSALILTYTISNASDASPDLDYVSTSSFTLNSGTINSATGVAADLTLPTVGGPNSLAGRKDMVVETTSPAKVSHVSSTDANGTYSVGDVIDVQVFFNAVVTVTGTPSITLETGASDATVNYVGGSGQRILVFRYTVASGQSASDLDYTSTGAISLNGGTIKSSGVDATLTLPSPGAALSLSGTKDFAIVPKVTSVTTTNSDGTYSAGDVIGVQVVFSAAVTVFGTPQIKLDVGSGLLVDYTSGSGTNTLLFNYTVQSSHETSHLEYRVASIVLNSGTVRDSAGRDASIKFPAVGATGSLGINRNIAIKSSVEASTVLGAAASAGFGTAVASAGDVNFDGYGDYIVGEPAAAAGGTNRGRAYVYSGQDGSRLYTVTQTTDGGKLGFSVGGGGDANGDSKSDFLVGIPYDTADGTGRGRVNVYSGADGTSLLTVAGSQDGAHFGWSVGMGGDLNGGGDGDFVVGAPDYDDGANADAGIVYVYSGAGTLIRSHTGPSAGAKFGYSVAVVGDTNGDGYADYIVGAPLTTNGRAYIYSGLTGTLLATLNGAESGAKFGFSVAGVGDTTGDGRSEVVVGEPYAAGEGVARGKAYLYNGSTGASITSRSGTDDNSNFGFSVSSAGDVNADGRADIAIAEPGAAGGGTSRGRVKIFSGLTGAQLYAVTGTEDSALMGYSVAPAGDVNADGYSDLVAGEPLGNGGATDSGKAHIYKSPVLVATAGPTVARVTSSSANGSFSTGNTIALKVVFTRPVTVTGTPQLTLETGSTDAVVNYTSGSGSSILTFNYTVGASHTASDLDYGSTGALALNGGTIKDSDGNSATLTLASPGTSGSLASQKSLAVNVSLMSGGGHGFIASGGSWIDYTGKAGTSAGAASAGSASSAAGGSGTAADSSSGASGITLFETPLITTLGDRPPRLLWRAVGDRDEDRLGLVSRFEGDLDGDGKSDLLVNGRSESERVQARKGTTGAALDSWTAEDTDRFGEAVTFVGDVNDDGVEDFLVGDPEFSVEGEVVGAVFLHDGSDFSLLRTHAGTHAGAKLGFSVARLGDWNGDGISEYAAGAPGIGDVQVFSGSDGAPLAVLSGQAGFGYSVSRAGDYDGDGQEDLIVGCPKAGERLRGEAYLYSGADSTALLAVSGTEDGAQLGFSVSGGLDVDGDGRPDLLIGAPFASGGGTHRGALYLYLTP